MIDPNLIAEMNKDEAGLIEDLILDKDLDRLETLTSGFNIFESLGVVRREVRHSDFLAFLLSPSESHGFHHQFLREFLFSITRERIKNRVLSPIDVDLFELGDVEVKREWEHIDVFLVSERNEFCVAIENKIDSTEHSNQLTRYRYNLRKQAWFAHRDPVMCRR